jgi:DNA-binding FadR family transcriptional regulator
LQARDRLDGDLFPMTHEMLGDLLGVRRTTITMAARALQSDGFIRYRHGVIQIRDRAALQKCACACYEIQRQLVCDLFESAAEGEG